MTQEQKQFFDQVIQPKLVQMAIDCTLPIDMNDLSYSYFENEAKEYNRIQAITNKVSKASEYLCCEDMIEVRKILEKIYILEDKTEMLDNVDGVQVTEQFEYTFTVQDFLEHLELI